MGSRRPAASARLALLQFPTAPQRLLVCASTKVEARCWGRLVQQLAWEGAPLEWIGWVGGLIADGCCK